ncbi:MAG: cation transporter [Cyclobacteriaceae bacterium]
MKMNTESAVVHDYNIHKLYRAAAALVAFTIVYNLLEGVVSVYFGIEDESLTLLGFGADSFIEVMSGIGIAHMIYRIRRNPQEKRDNFERTALRITGTAFYILVAGLVVTSVHNILTGHRPVTTFWGIVIAGISILIMWALILAKSKVGRELNSPAILADAQCTKVCIYMSLILLGASAIYELTGIPYIDSIGTLGLAFFSFKEGKECFEKASSDNACSCDQC